MKKPVELIYIGDSFYHESGTIMSPIYCVAQRAWQRWDWGKVSIALDEGQQVTIKPATEREIEHACKILKDIRAGR